MESHVTGERGQCPGTTKRPRVKPGFVLLLLWEKQTEGSMTVRKTRMRF